MRAAFNRRQTVFPNRLPLALTIEFAADTQKQTQRKAFLRKNKLNGAPDFGNIITALEKFFSPLIQYDSTTVNSNIIVDIVVVS